ncbi:MAG: gfo/Idh/MocA family oxidoreductase, partial [Spirochaetaceae bacterium]|nr:gfo/Idh/MocA family oxidoreductase [Spirochaetaceae bacterium]
GTHLVDIVLYLLSFAQKDSSTENLLSNPKLVSIFKDEKDAVRNLRVNFQNDFCKDVSFNFSGRSKFFGFEVDIVGTEGRIYIGNGFAKIYLRKESKLYSGFYSLTKQKIKFPKKTLYFANMVQNAVDCLDGESELKSTLETGIETLQILEQIKTLIE